MLKEEKIPQLTKNEKLSPTECVVYTVKEAMEDTKGFLFNFQLEGQFEKTTYCVSVLVFLYNVSPADVCKCGEICQNHFVKDL